MLRQSKTNIDGYTNAFFRWFNNIITGMYWEWNIDYRDVQGAPLQATSHSDVFGI